MNYNTELINGMAKQAVAGITEALHLSIEGNPPGIQAVETTYGIFCVKSVRKRWGNIYRPNPVFRVPPLPALVGVN